MKGRVGLGLVLGSLVAAGTVFMGEAGAAPIACGTKLMQSTVLDADVGPCTTEFGLGIYADNIVLDLNGNRVFGSPEKLDDLGIYFAARRGSTVRNGTVTGFRDGIVVAGGADNTITAMNVVDNIGQLEGAHRGFGIYMANEERARVIRNVVRHNGPTAGIYLEGASNTRIENNLIVDNNLAQSGIGGHGPLGQSDRGIGILSGPFGRFASLDNQILNNVIRGNGHHGISTSVGSNRTVIRGNTVTNNGVDQLPAFPDAEGILLESNANVVTNNNVRDSSGSGIRIFPHFISVDLQLVPVDGVNNRIERNVSLGNGHGPSFSHDLDDETFECDNNIWSGNLFATALPACLA